MNFQTLSAKVAGLSMSQASWHILNNLNCTLVQNHIAYKMWKVNGHSEIDYLTLTDTLNNKVELKASFLD